MKYEVYPDLAIRDDFQTFEFRSIGNNNSILKRIKFKETEIPTIFNLHFGDVDQNDDIDDNSISNNDDRDKILATIAKVVEMYTIAYPERWVYFRGSTKERTRLYRMAIGLNLEELQEKFEIYAEIGNQKNIVKFEKKMQVFAFLIKRKNI